MSVCSVLVKLLSVEKALGLKSIRFLTDFTMFPSVPFRVKRIHNSSSRNVQRRCPIVLKRPTDTWRLKL